MNASPPPTGRVARRGVWPQWSARIDGAAAVVVGLLGVVFAVVAIDLSLGVNPHRWWIAAPTQAVGVAILGAGLYAWLRPADGRRMGRLLVAVGVTWYLGDLQFSTDPLVYRLGFWLYHLNVVVLAHALLAFPGGRLVRRSERLTIAAMYATVLFTQGLRAIVEEPLQAQNWGSPDGEFSIWAPVGSVLAVALTAVTVVLVAQRWKAEPVPVRWAHGLYWAAVATVGVVVVLSSVAALVRAPIEVNGWLLLLYAGALVLLGVAVVSGLLRTQLATHLRVATLLVELRARPGDGSSLRLALAKALDDPSVTLHYRRADSDDYVDAHGEPAPLPTDGDRWVTYVRAVDGRPLAALVHHPVLAGKAQHRRRLHAVVAAAGLAIENARLHAENRAHLRGLVAAEHNTRRSIRAALHDGPQHRLTAIQLLLGEVRKHHRHNGLDAELQQIADELQATVQDLREVTQGIYPSNLGMAGLADALDPLAQRSPIPLILDIAAGRWEPRLEETAFFVISEGVGNVHKHARATTVFVRVREISGRLVIEISDDGVGGAAPTANGSGLRGMRDRVAAHEGTLTITSPHDGGTTIRAVLPCE